MLSKLEDIRAQFHQPEYALSDPVHFLFAYSNIIEREIVGMLASSLAFGRVKQINLFIQNVLDNLPKPLKALSNMKKAKIKKYCKNLRYRFIKGEDIAELLYATTRVQNIFGSLNSALLYSLARVDYQMEFALPHFTKILRNVGMFNGKFLIPLPTSNSAFKRINLFFRWMVRKDEIDPGGWIGIAPNLLIVPLDTHIYKFAQELRITLRKTKDLKTALEITQFFRQLCPKDPLRFDFSLMHFYRLVPENGFAKL